MQSINQVGKKIKPCIFNKILISFYKQCIRCLFFAGSLSKSLLAVQTYRDLKVLVLTGIESARCVVSLSNDQKGRTTPN